MTPCSCVESNSKKKNSYAHFKCNLSKKDGCHSFIRLPYVNGFISIISYNHIHSHGTDRMYIEASTNVFASEEKVRKLRASGASPGFIRRCLNSSSNSQDLYNVSRSGISEKFSE